MPSSALTAEIDIIVEVDLPPEGDIDSLRDLMTWVLTEEDANGEWNIALALTSDDELRILHRDFMGLDTETDVMTFPSGDASEPGAGGDIAVSVDRASAQAGDFGLSAWDEVRFLAVHGVLHLCGWDDASGEERSAMLARQTELIETFDRRRLGR